MHCHPAECGAADTVNAMKTDAQVFREAAAIIRRGWTQGETDRDGAYCALGALGVAACCDKPFETVQFRRCAQLLVATLGLDGAGYYLPIIRWNDYVLQTQEQVADGFDLAAAVCEQLPEPEEVLV